MRVTVIGTGYVGLVTGACLAEVGNHVICVDKDERKIDALVAGDIPIFEPGLDSVVAGAVSSGRLEFTTDLAKGVAHGEILMIAVGTPPGEDGSADLSHVLAVASAIGQNIDEYRVVVTKSTVPVGTADKVRGAIDAQLAQRDVAIDFSVVSNPEFLKEGAAIEDFMKPDRIVVGSDDERASEAMRELYSPFNRNRDRVMIMDVRSAELTKYAANAMLATKISFMNEMANLAERLGADIEAVRLGIGSDPRIGYHFIYPGCGYGGSCFPKDVQALHRTAGQVDYDARILAAVEAVNHAQKEVPVAKLKQHFGDLSGRKIALWGLAFKPNTDDMREAPSLVIIDELLSAGATVVAYDPVASNEAVRHLSGRGGLTIADSADDATDGADALVVVTEWREFRSPDFNKLMASLTSPVIVDGRNIYDPIRVRDQGFTYYGIGRQ